MLPYLRRALRCKREKPCENHRLSLVESRHKNFSLHFSISFAQKNEKSRLGMKKLIALLLVSILCLLSVSALAEFSFGPWTTGPTTWKQSRIFAPEGTTWQVRLNVINSYAVGRVFYAGQNTYGSAKWTYDASMQGTWRTEKDYTDGALLQSQLTWGMRKNDSYTGTVTLAGLFRP